MPIGHGRAGIVGVYDRVGRVQDSARPPTPHRHGVCDDYLIREVIFGVVGHIDRIVVAGEGKNCDQVGVGPPQLVQGGVGDDWPCATT